MQNYKMMKCGYVKATTVLMLRCKEATKKMAERNMMQSEKGSLRIKSAEKSPNAISS